MFLKLHTRSLSYASCIKGCRIRQKQCKVYRLVKFLFSHFKLYYTVDLISVSQIFVFPFQTILDLVDEWKNPSYSGDLEILTVTNGVVELKNTSHMRLEFHQPVLVTNFE